MRHHKEYSIKVKREASYRQGRMVPLLCHRCGPTLNDVYEWQHLKYKYYLHEMNRFCLEFANSTTNFVQLRYMFLH